MTMLAMISLDTPEPAPGETGNVSPSVAENLCPVVANHPVNDEYRLLVVDAPEVALTARAGQFFHLACPPDGEAGNFLRRPMSIHRIDRDKRQLHFLYKVQGSGTRGLANLGAGDVLDALGPLGKGFVLPNVTQHVLMIGRGVGLATLAPLAREGVAVGAHVTAILSARTASLLMAEGTLRDDGASVIIVTDEAENSDPVALEGLLMRIHADRPIDFVATCGSKRLARLLQGFAQEHGIAGQVALEQRMGCALGMCFACVMPFRCPGPDGEQATSYKRVCWDGPVFDLAEAVI
ncbi:dihydroorotate dehydrogenase electron transfer subunit [Sphingobium sp. AP50]|uniref:dihydroorotate dehydrogenase electron transfer subunit n=1 Tax=Sphingobium sp. AP50 TaxID=1884369 RepID=UPI0008B89052|nr:dihydroorotate dehydrogenase electron transfer subunit [Sphingobium sp. AP50]SEK00749.1 dihydroorotate dehydrogenase electron transfer subunit [Sphingobium sp. AP50]